MVGAVVLIAAAVILIPEMLSGPKSSSTSGDVSASSSEAPADASKLKTYTIDLSKAASSIPAEAPSSSTSESAARTLPEPASATAVPPPEEPVANQSAPAVDTAKKATEVPREPERAVSSEVAANPPQRAQADAKKESAANSGGWSVQVGSFGVRATSERVATDLKKDGFAAFVVAFQSGNQTMYRVRVGPERDRAAAEGLLRKLKLHHPGATLVPPA
jgi:DedD protein